MNITSNKDKIIKKDEKYKGKMKKSKFNSNLVDFKFD